MIDSYSFGKMVIDGKIYKRDLIIAGGKVIPDWYRKGGHKVEIEDAEAILASNPDIVIFGKGKPGLMKTTAPLRRLLEEKGIELIETGTSKAIETYNSLTKASRNVAAGFHLTC